MSRPDISIYLAHFTSHKFPKGRNNKENPTNEFMYTPPIKRLENILREKTIRDLSYHGLMIVKLYA